MAIGTYLPSTLLMGLFLIAMFVALVRIRDGSGVSQETRSRVSDLPDITGDVPARSEPTDTVSSEAPIEWVVGFILLVIAAGAGAILFIGEYSLPAMGTQTGIFIAALLGGIVCGYLFSGVYISLRSHGRKSAEATAVAIWLLGLIVVGVITVKLALIQ